MACCVLLRKCESSAYEVKMATLACIVLHNVCIEQGDAISKKCDLSIDPITNQKRDRDCPSIAPNEVMQKAERHFSGSKPKFYLEEETGDVV